MIYVLDTHPLVWFLVKDSRLSKDARLALRDSSAEIVIPTIVLLEMNSLYAKGRITVDAGAAKQQFIAKKNCLLYPLDEQVVSLAPTTLNIHDSIIVGTALYYRDVLNEEVALITKDKEIADSKLIEVIW